MIEPANGWRCGDQFFPSIVDAQKYEIASMVNEKGMAINCCETADFIIANKDQILDILTMRKGSKPRARKINGGTKRRKTTAEQATPELPAKVQDPNKPF